jgi:geranylgeranyl reductase
MESRYDVIIVGGGPGGLACAHQLDNSGLAVLLIEKNRLIGPKNCAGGLTHKTCSLDIPEDKTKGFRVQNVFLMDEQFRIELVHPLRTISRSDLGQHQLHKLKDSRNITILKDTVVEAISENEVLTDKGVFHYRCLVGADGSHSIVRRYLKLKFEYCAGLYYEIPGVTDQCIWYANPRLLHSGYIWEFPHRDHTNIGIYFNPKQIKPKKATEILKQYLRDKNYEFAEDTLKGAAINYSFQGCIFNNIFLVGDAAGLPPKPTGEGICFALISGREIGNKILDQDYTMSDLRKILRYKKRQERLLKMFESFPRGQIKIIKLIFTLLKKGWFQSYLGI